MKFIIILRNIKEKDSIKTLKDIYHNRYIDGLKGIIEINEQTDVLKILNEFSDWHTVIEINADVSFFMNNRIRKINYLNIDHFLLDNMYLYSRIRNLEGDKYLKEINDFLLMIRESIPESKDDISYAYPFNEYFFIGEVYRNILFDKDNPNIRVNNLYELGKIIKKAADKTSYVDAKNNNVSTDDFIDYFIRPTLETVINDYVHEQEWIVNNKRFSLLDTEVKFITTLNIEEREDIKTINKDNNMLIKELKLKV